VTDLHSIREIPDGLLENAHQVHGPVIAGEL